MQPYIDALAKIDEQKLVHIAERLFDLMTRQHTVFVAGNGGSYCVAQHFASDLMWGASHPSGQFPRSVICLGSNVPATTALANDRGYEYVFSEQALWHNLGGGSPLITFSVSGMSPNIKLLHHTAVDKRASVIDICGRNEISGVTGRRPVIAVDPDIDPSDPLYYYVCESAFSAIAHEIARIFHQKWAQLS